MSISIGSYTHKVSYLAMLASRCNRLARYVGNGARILKTFDNVPGMSIVGAVAVLAWEFCGSDLRNCFTVADVPTAMTAGCRLGVALGTSSLSRMISSQLSGGSMPNAERNLQRKVGRTS